MSTYRTIDPATGRLVREYETASETLRYEALDHASAAFRDWRGRPLAERTSLLRRLADGLERDAEALAGLMATEMGKRLPEGRAEAGKCAWVCRWYAEQAEAFLEPQRQESDGREAWLRFDPLGPVLAIMPWNFPFWQFFRFAAPALAAGNAALLKHAPSTPGCALDIERRLLDAGAPRGLVRNMFLSDEQAAETIRDARVAAVTFTGSSRGGANVAAVAGAALKKAVLELGGSDAFVVFDDADLDAALDTAVLSRCINSGQSCIAAKRFFVQDGIYDRFRDGMVDRMRALRCGDPRDEATDLGPLAREDLRDTLAAQVEGCRAAGAHVLCGGETPQGDGFFYPATVLEDAPLDSPAAREELFGPVAPLFRFRSEDEALAAANASDYGLGGSLWTGDDARARRWMPRFESGALFVNGLVKSDPRLPFGGVKRSGYGRELGREGLLEFVNRKSVWIG